MEFETIFYRVEAWMRRSCAYRVCLSNHRIPNFVGFCFCTGEASYIPEIIIGSQILSNEENQLQQKSELHENSRQFSSPLWNPLITQI